PRRAIVWLYSSCARRTQSRGDGSVRQRSVLAQCSALTASSRAACRSAGGPGWLVRSTLVSTTMGGGVCVDGSGDVCIGADVCAIAAAPAKPSAAMASNEIDFMATPFRSPTKGIVEKRQSACPSNASARLLEGHHRLVAQGAQQRQLLL